MTSASEVLSDSVVPLVDWGTLASASTPRSMATQLTPVVTPVRPESCAPASPPNCAELLAGEGVTCLSPGAFETDMAEGPLAKRLTAPGEVVKTPEEDMVGAI